MQTVDQASGHNLKWNRTETRGARLDCREPIEERPALIEHEEVAVHRSNVRGIANSLRQPRVVEIWPPIRAGQRIYQQVWEWNVTGKSGVVVEPRASQGSSSVWLTISQFPSITLFVSSDTEIRCLYVSPWIRFKRSAVSSGSFGLYLSSRSMNERIG
jgi:hypothetical protein